MVPDKHIRKAIKEGLEALTSVFVTEQALPISKDTPSLHVQLNSQSRRRTSVSKQNYDWEGTVTLTIVKVNEKGYISSAEMDDLDNQIVGFMDNLQVPGFWVKQSTFFTSNTDNLESPANTINRKHIMYEIWIKALT